MRTAVLLLALLPALTGAAPPKDPDQKPGCYKNGATPAADSKGSAGVKRLDQLPPANEYLTVIHSEGGCMKPVIARYDVDGRTRQR